MENRPMDTVGEGEWDEWREWQGNMHITVCKQTVGENLLHHSGSSDRSSVTTTERHRMGWEVRGRSRGRGRTVPRLIHADARQKATRYCQAILLQLKRYIFFKKDTLSCKSLTSSHQQPSLLPQEVLYSQIAGLGRRHLQGAALLPPDLTIGRANFY